MVFSTDGAVAGLGCRRSPEELKRMEQEAYALARNEFELMKQTVEFEKTLPPMPRCIMRSYMREDAQKKDEQIREQQLVNGI